MRQHGNHDDDAVLNPRDSSGSVRLPGAVVRKLLTAGPAGPWANGLPIVHRFLPTLFLTSYPFNALTLKFCGLCNNRTLSDAVTSFVFTQLNMNFFFF